MHQLFVFLLAVASSRYGVHVHAFCVMSNHVHLVLTDPGARLPAFHQYLDGLLARAMNALLGRSEHFWDSSGYAPVELGTHADVVEKCAYVLANPVAAGLVELGRLWPGPWSAPETIGAGPLVVARPEHFFAEDGALPPTASLELVPPPGLDAETFRRELRRALEAKEAAAHQMRSAFVGAARVLAQKPTTRPSEEEPRRTLRPRVSSVDATKRSAMLARLTEFWRSYRASLAARRAGKPDVTFPAGTYLLRVAHGVPCAAFG